MTGRSPARLLAPAALVAALVALFVVISSPSGNESAESDASPTPVATAEATPERKAKDEKPSGGTYTVEAGDTPSSIAAEQDVDLDALLEANPDIDPDGLSIGEELQLP
jgi:resuscitation-promoting factor RpfA